MVGLDAAGKTTILYKLKLGEIVTTIPIASTSRPSSTRTSRSRCGTSARTIRPLYRLLLPGHAGRDLRRDSNDRDRVDEARDELTPRTQRGRAPPGDPPRLRQQAGPAERDERLRDHRQARPPPCARSWYIRSTCATTGDGLYRASTGSRPRSRARSERVRDRCTGCVLARGSGLLGLLFSNRKLRDNYVASRGRFFFFGAVPASPPPSMRATSAGSGPASRAARRRGAAQRVAAARTRHACASVALLPTPAPRAAFRRRAPPARRRSSPKSSTAAASSALSALPAAKRSRKAAGSEPRRLDADEGAARELVRAGRRPQPPQRDEPQLLLRTRRPVSAHGGSGGARRAQRLSSARARRRRHATRAARRRHAVVEARRNYGWAERRAAVCRPCDHVVAGCRRMWWWTRRVWRRPRPPRRAARAAVAAALLRSLLGLLGLAHRIAQRAAVVFERRRRRAVKQARFTATQTTIFRSRTAGGVSPRRQQF